MEHVKSRVIVYQTDNYKLFKLIDGNRPMNKNKIARIIKEIQGGNDVLDEVPILVRENKNYLEVVDGQHRLEIAKQLKRPVTYILKKQEMTLHAVAKLNSNTEKWTSDNFINAYVKHGNEHYKKLQSFRNKYGMAVGLCLRYLTNGIEKPRTGGATMTANFEQGLFEVKKYKDAVLIAETCKNFEAFPQWNTRNFVEAIVKILQYDQCDFDVLLRKFNKDPRKLQSQPDLKGYLNNLQVIYNFDNNKQKPIY